MSRKMFPAILALGALALTGPTVAEERDPSGERVATVRGRGLDLTREADAAIMLQRLHRAADAVCGVGEVARPTPSAQRAMDRCVETAVAEAIAELDAPVLARLHESQMAQVAYRR